MASSFAYSSLPPTDSGLCTFFSLVYLTLWDPMLAKFCIKIFASAVLTRYNYWIFWLCHNLYLKDCFANKLWFIQLHKIGAKLSPFIFNNIIAWDIHNFLSFSCLHRWGQIVSDAVCKVSMLWPADIAKTAISELEPYDRLSFWCDTVNNNVVLK